MSTEDLADFFAAKRVLITGGLGFIGSALARELAAVGSDVAIIDSLVPHHGGRLESLDGTGGKVTVEVGDVRDTEALVPLMRDRDFVLNLVGQTSHLDSMREPFGDLAYNCEAQLAVLEACRHHNPEGKIVFTSTRQVYGRPRELPVDESHPLAPVDVNGIHKIAGEQYHRLYAETYGLPVTILRLTNTYGPRMRVLDARQTFLGYWLRLVLTGEEIQIFGDGSQRRDLNYVGDVVRAILLAAAQDSGDATVYNLGDDRVVSLLEIAELLIALNGEGSYRVIPFPAEQKAIDIGDYFGDWSAFADSHGWRPAVSLEDGLQQTLDFFRGAGRTYLSPPAQAV